MLPIYNTDPVMDVIIDNDDPFTFTFGSYVGMDLALSPDCNFEISDLTCIASDLGAGLCPMPDNFQKTPNIEF